VCDAEPQTRVPPVARHEPGDQIPCDVSTCFTTPGAACAVGGRQWLARQPAFVELTFVPAGSEPAEQLFPGLSRPGVPEELVVVSDDGAVYRDSHAWIMCLYALQDYREWSFRLAQPALLPLARQAFALFSRNRGRISRWLQLASETETAETLHHVVAPPCEFANPTPAPAPAA
jgi:predicted DCC family thiol-disulfide oxidoreductase YuxK